MRHANPFILYIYVLKQTSKITCFFLSTCKDPIYKCCCTNSVTFILREGYVIDEYTGCQSKLHGHWPNCTLPV